MPEVIDVKGEPRHFHHKYKFKMFVTGIGTLDIQNCSELKSEIAKIEYYEGGVAKPFKEAGRIQFSDLTIERAATHDAALYNWMVDTVNASQNKGLNTDKYKRDARLYQLDRNNGILRLWKIYGAWPMSFTAGSWDNNSDELTIEQVVLCIDYFALGPNYTTGDIGPEYNPLTDIL